MSSSQSMPEPTTSGEAMENENDEHWIQVMNVESNALMQNRMWSLPTFRPGVEEQEGFTKSK